jgi:hypothetical protein
VTSASSVTASRAWLAVDLAQCVANPRKGVSSFLDCVYGVVCQGLSDVMLGGGGAPFLAVFGSGRVFIEVSCRWRSVTGADP